MGILRGNYFSNEFEMFYDKNKEFRSLLLQFSIFVIISWKSQSLGIVIWIIVFLLPSFIFAKWVLS